MYLTKLSFKNIPRFLTKSQLHQEHQFIMSLFPTMENKNPRSELNILYRAELQALAPHFLIQSLIAPDIENIKNQQTASQINLETKNIAAIYDKILQAPKISYKIRVNPVKTINGTRTPVRGEKEIFNWWLEKVKLAGLNLDKDKTQIVIERNKTLKDKISVSTATITGLAEVHNVGQLQHILTEGIGKEKSYGYGLLLLGRA